MEIVREESFSDRIAAIRARGRRFPVPPNMPDTTPVVPSVHAQREEFGFDASDIPARRFYAIVARHLIDVARYEPFIAGQADPSDRVPNPDHFKDLAQAGRDYVDGVAAYFSDSHGVDTAAMYEQARRDIDLFFADAVA